MFFAKLTTATLMTDLSMSININSEGKSAFFIIVITVYYSTIKMEVEKLKPQRLPCYTRMNKATILPSLFTTY